VGTIVSRLTDLIAQLKLKDSQLALDLEKEIKVLSSRLPFGLNFERHSPELVQLPSKRIRKNDKVQILNEKGKLTESNSQIWLVKNILSKDGNKIAVLESIGLDEVKKIECLIDNLVCIIEFRDKIYPGLISTGKVERGDDKVFHTVINGENYHVLKALTFTHRGKLDVIYIDPPYNSGAKDWKYNNDYVVKDDIYRHSKWLAMIERRLLIAKQLLKPKNSVLIVTIDEKEYLRLGMLLEQIFPYANIQMISAAINPKGSSRNGFRRSDEYIFIVMFGDCIPERLPLSEEWAIYYDNADSLDDNETKTPKSKNVKVTPEWTSMMRRGTSSLRKDVPNGFYPIYVDPNHNPPKIVCRGDALKDGEHEAPFKEGLIAVLPKRTNGSEGRWQVVTPEEFETRLKQGCLRVGRKTDYGYVINYLPEGAYADVLSDKFKIDGYAPDGSIIAYKVETHDLEDNIINDDRIAPTQWHVKSHNASENGTTLLNALLGRLRSFDYAKSLYAVEDVLRFFVKSKPNAKILDFFAGSGTTAHAVMRLNKQDGGNRQCISVTNNEVSAAEQKQFREQGLRPGDSDWEKWGICEYITKPRIKAAITGLTPDGKPIQGEYKFNDEFPMSEGLKENAEFFTLSYESVLAISHNIAFKQIAPLLWMRAGSRGRRIDEIPSTGWDIVDTYGLLVNIDLSEDFSQEMKKYPDIQIAYIVTDDERVFQSIAKKLPKHIEPVRLYESYLNNFSFANGDD